MSKYDLILQEHIRVLSEFNQKELEKFVNLLESTIKSNRNIWICGNGGSATTAAHLATDLTKGVYLATGRQVKAICINEFLGIQTAWSNDYSYEESFFETIKSLSAPEDLVIVISGSGSSKNLVHLAANLKNIDLKLGGILGMGGGNLLPLCDEAVVIKSSNMQIIENFHLIIVHLIYNHLSGLLHEFE